MTVPALKAPFPYFGGKSRAASLIWSKLGDVPHYIEPFAGSLAVLLGRPHSPRIETVNDIDVFICNFWRALQCEPDGVVHWADGPVNEADLHARHLWLVSKPDFRERMFTDPDFYDVKIAGWWVWGISNWIGEGWCQFPNPSQPLPSFAEGFGGGRGVDRLSRSGQLLERCHALATRLRQVRVACGDWTRIVTSSLLSIDLTGILLDPPYGEDLSHRMYQVTDPRIAKAVCKWAIEHGDDPKIRIVLCGYEGQYDKIPSTWTCEPWTAQKGHSNSDNRYRERVWCSPYCLKPEVSLFGD